MRVSQGWGLYRCRWELSQICDVERAFKIRGFCDRLCLIILWAPMDVTPPLFKGRGGSNFQIAHSVKPHTGTRNAQRKG